MFFKLCKDVIATHYRHFIENYANRPERRFNMDEDTIVNAAVNAMIEKARKLKEVCGYNVKDVFAETDPMIANFPVCEVAKRYMTRLSSKEAQVIHVMFMDIPSTMVTDVMSAVDKVISKLTPPAEEKRGTSTAPCIPLLISIPDSLNVYMK